MRFLLPNPDAPITVPYTAFKEQVAKDNVEAIYSRGESIEGRFATAGDLAAARTRKPRRRTDAKPTRSRAPAKTFTTTLPAFVDPGLEAFLIDHGVEISAEPIQRAAARWRRCCSASARRS